MPAPYIIAFQNFHDQSKLFIHPLSISLTSSILSSNILLIDRQLCRSPQPRFKLQTFDFQTSVLQITPLRHNFDLFIILTILTSLMLVLYNWTSCHARHPNLYKTLIKLTNTVQGPLKRIPWRSYTIIPWPKSLVQIIGCNNNTQFAIRLHDFYKQLSYSKNLLNLM